MVSIFHLRLLSACCLEDYIHIFRAPSLSSSGFCLDVISLSVKCPLIAPYKVYPSPAPVLSTLFSITLCNFLYSTCYHLIYIYFVIVFLFQLKKLLTIIGTFVLFESIPRYSEQQWACGRHNGYLLNEW